VPLPGGVTAHTIGKPRRYETPLHLPSHGALVFGDAVAEADGRLVVWSTERVDAKVERFYRERFNPTLELLLELDFDRVLVTHGKPVLQGGREQLEQALRAEPWYRE
jgi:glyoxylase-like metal-dependent hydrolase (beta-lactamase superfamily II)